MLEPLGLSRMFVHWTIKRYNNTGRVRDCKRSERPRAVQTWAAVKAARERIRRNPLRRQKIISWKSLNEYFN